MKNKPKLRAEMVISPNAKPFTAELAAQAFFGMSLENLVREIKENKDGKYDRIYK